MGSDTPGRSHRTPIKHFVLNMTLGRVIGALTSGSFDIPARLPIRVVDLCAGDGRAPEGETSSPEIIHKHINFPGLRGKASATFFEIAANNYDSLRGIWGGQHNIEIIHGNANAFRLAGDPMQAAFIHIDPNSLGSWPVTPDMARSFGKATTFLATLGCNVGGLKQLGFDTHRREWYDHIRCLADLPAWHDLQLYVLNRDAAQWAYLLRIPTAWAEQTSRVIMRHGSARWPAGLGFASMKKTPDTFHEMLDGLFMTKKERKNGTR